MIPNFHRVNFGPSRKADFQLGGFDDSVFIDMNVGNDDCIYLKRISFDGYGCCDVGEPRHYLNRTDSIEFISHLEKQDLDQNKALRYLYKLIKLNQDHIWPDAYAEYFGEIDLSKI